MKKSVEIYISEFKNKLFEKFVKKEIDKFIEKEFNLNSYKYFSEINEIENWGDEYNFYYQDLIKLSRKSQASKEQLEELDDLDDYCGHYAEKINDHLRGKTNDEYLNERILKMDTYINKFLLKENIIVVRRMPNEFIDKKYKINSSFIEKGFLSTSLNLSYRLDYDSEYKPLKNETLIIIKIPKGIQGIYIEKVLPEKKQRKEYEFLISRNQTLKIEYNKRMLSNRLIKMKIINVDIKEL